MQNRSRFERGAAAALLVVVTVAITTVLAEVVVRTYARVSDSGLANLLRVDPFAVKVEAHGELGYRQRPNQVLNYANGSVATSNELGYRGPVVTPHKPAGTFRVVLLGGSTTHGWDVGDDSTIDAHMRRLLAQRVQGRHTEVINLGFDGYDSYQLYERLKTDGMPLTPDVVIINTGINDVRNARYANLVDKDPRTMLWLSEVERSRDEQARGGPSVWTRVKHHVVLARLPSAVRKQFAPARVAAPITRPQPDAMDYFERNLGRIVDLTRGTSTVVLFAIAPSSLLTKYAPQDTSDISYWIVNADITQTYRDSLDERLQRFVERRAAAGEPVGRVPYLLLPPDVFLDDTHLTSEGNARVAERFVTALAPILNAQPLDYPQILPLPSTRLQTLGTARTAATSASTATGGRH